MSQTPETHIDFYRRWNALARPYFSWQLEQFGSHVGNRIADIGCGIGNFTPLLENREAYIGIDIDEELVQTVSSQFAKQPNVTIHEHDILDASVVPYLRQQGIDTIISVNVIEHIDNDELALEHMAAALPVGGKLCLLVPAFSFLFGTLDELDHHFRRYTKKMMLKKTAELPLKPLKTYYFNAVGSVGWFLKGRILKEKTHADGNYKMMNRLIPVLRPIEKIMHPPVGLSLVAVFEKI